MTPALRSFALVIGIVLASAPGCADAQSGASGAIGVRKPAPALEKPADALSVLVIGDWGRHGEHNQRLVASAMDRAASALDAELVISTGDNFYPNGIQSTGDPNIRASFEDVYRQHALQVDWLVALGNHDYRGNAQAQVDYTAKSRRWRMPSRYFAVKKAIDDSTSVEFFILDTSPFQRDYYA
ncbi:MAG: metallophosphoesterase, partial [Gemmatimonadaceae bacterium]|nr:metallophosphoesterase [Gemmatimonadaceae bacterium]